MEEMLYLKAWLYTRKWSVTDMSQAQGWQKGQLDISLEKYTGTRVSVLGMPCHGFEPHLTLMGSHQMYDVITMQKAVPDGQQKKRKVSV